MLYTWLLTNDKQRGAAVRLWIDRGSTMVLAPLMMIDD